MSHLGRGLFIFLRLVHGGSGSCGGGGNSCDVIPFPLLILNDDGCIYV